MTTYKTIQNYRKVAASMGIDKFERGYAMVAAGREDSEIRKAGYTMQELRAIHFIRDERHKAATL